MTEAEFSAPPEIAERRGASVLQWCSYWLFRGFFGFLCLLPEKLSYGLAGWLGVTHCRISKKRKAYALQMLRRAYPDETDDSKLLKLAQQGTANLLKVSIDMALTTRRLKDGTFANYVDMSELKDLGLASPWIGVSGHLGGWESGAIGACFAGFEVHVTARGIKNPLLHDWVVESRRRAGMEIHDRRGGMRSVAAALEKGAVLMQIVDQYQRKRGVKADWFGSPVSCERAAATLAVRRGYPLLVATCVRVGSGFRFKWVNQEVVQPVQTGDRNAAVQATVEKINRGLERLILRYPEQYLWIHNRYREKV
ncbi:MAG: lysophospholipid acyltransferase family protein [Planctomycetota bacterium]|jgi:KDO2-lipid IV(A) lauroyltransferase